MTTSKESKKQVTIITGFLGSGKTTLLSHLLSEPSGKKTAVLVNEFGEVGLDHHLLRPFDERTILLGGGCLCCTIREDLVRNLKELLDLEERGEVTESIESIVIETSGLADPAPILFTLMNDPVLQHHYVVDQVIVTVDAVNGQNQLDRQPETIKQIACADQIFITKTDMVQAEEIEILAKRIRAIVGNAAKIILSRPGHRHYHHQVNLGDIPEGKKKNKPQRPLKTNQHTTGTSSISLTFDYPLDWTAFGLWLSMLLNARGSDILRVKGMIDVGGTGPVVLNGVQHIIHEPQHLSSWPTEKKMSSIVFIMRSVDPQLLLHSLDAFAPMMGAYPGVGNVHASYTFS